MNVEERVENHEARLNVLETDGHVRSREADALFTQLRKVEELQEKTNHALFHENGNRSLCGRVKDVETALLKHLQDCERRDERQEKYRFWWRTGGLVFVAAQVAQVVLFWWSWCN